MSTPDHNPYAAPVPPQRFGPEPRTQVQQVAIALLVTTALWLVWVFAATLLQIPMIMETWQNDPLQMALPRITGILLPFPWNLAVLWGSIQMLRMRSYRSAKLAAWLALTPLCGPCGFMGIPLGIWALIVLRRPEVKAAFLD